MSGISCSIYVVGGVILHREEHISEKGLLIEFATPDDFIMV